MAGLKSLAKELPKYGRYGDTIVAHINPQEAALLKALGGSGTINPTTGLPEYWGGLGALNPFNPGSAAGKAVGSIPGVKQLQNVATQAFQPIEKAIVQPVSSGLAEFDKQVARTIPGGWGTIGQVALSMMGAPAPLQIAYGAARGSGIMRTGSSLKRANLQGAVIGGATAYAMSELGDYMRGASDSAIEAGKEGLSEEVAKELAKEAAPITDYSQSLTPPPPPVTTAPPISYDPGYYDIDPNLPTSYSPTPTPSILDKLATKAGDAMSGTAKFVTEIPTSGVSTAGDTLSGIKNLTGLGDVTAKEAAAQAATTGIKALPMTAMAVYGETSLAGLEEQRKYLEEAKKAKTISDAEYQQALDSINRQRDYAQSVVNQYPITLPAIDVSRLGSSLYKGSSEPLYKGSSKTLYAMGGQVDDELGGDYSAMGMDQGNLQKGLFGQGYSMGGTPRFLSGGGDGMSDSIPATINNKQPARLADGEFVIPADVVSHLGNGSSKAGAKQLYSMMDRIRTARTGNKKQGKQVNPRKYMPA